MVQQGPVSPGFPPHRELLLALSSSSLLQNVQAAVVEASGVEVHPMCSEGLMGTKYISLLLSCVCVCVCVCLNLHKEARGYPQVLSFRCPAWNSLCGLGSLSTEPLVSTCLCVPSTGLEAWGLPALFILHGFWE